MACGLDYFSGPSVTDLKTIRVGHQTPAINGGACNSPFRYNGPGAATLASRRVLDAVGTGDTVQPAVSGIIRSPYQGRNLQVELADSPLGDMSTLARHSEHVTCGRSRCPERVSFALYTEAQGKSCKQSLPFHSSLP